MRRIIALIALSIYVHVSVADEVGQLAFQAYVPRGDDDHGLDRPAAMALKSKAEWQSLWNQVEPSMSRDMAQRTPHPSPIIDFERYTLLVIAIGSRPSGGFSVVIDAVREFPSEIRVAAHERMPGANCTVTTIVTHPIAYALIPRTTKPVRFDIHKAAIAC